MQNFLGDYLFYASGNEAHPNYHLWSGLAALSSIVSRRVWVPQGYFNVYPNLYIVLLGPPGNKKTTAMNIAKGVVREMKAIPFSAECQTKESLVKELKEYTRSFKLKEVDGVERSEFYTPISIFVTELSQFLGPNSGHMIDFLVTVYDAKVYDLNTKNKGGAVIEGPYVTILACTTPEWVTTYLKTDIITGGFTRRTIFVLEFEDGDPIPFPVITNEQAEAYKRVISYGQELMKTSGPFVWDPDAEQFYSHWYRTREIPKDPTTRGYFKTKPGQLLKIAMLLSLSKSPDLVMRKDSLEAGLALLDKMEVNLPKVFQGMGRNELNSVASKILELLESTGPIPEKKLVQLMYREATTPELFQVMNHLRETDRIIRAETPAKDGEPKRFFVALPHQLKK